MASLSWLHVSDLHCLNPTTNWDSQEILHSILEDLSILEQKHNLKPDLVFFTGDAAFGETAKIPIAEQFEYAGEFFEKLRTAFSKEISRDNIFIVPGNHDVNRENVTDDQTHWLDTEAHHNVICRLIAESDKQWKRYIERQAEFAEFLNIWGYNHLLKDRDHLVFHSIRDISGLSIGIAGFNSAWSSSRDNEKGKLWFGGQWQVQELASRLEKTDISIALMHHPPNWFVEQDDAKTWRLIERKFNFLLHGHEHENWVEVKDSDYIRIGSAACYNRPDSENGYNLVRLDLDNNTCEVWLRKYDSRGGGWVSRPVARHAPEGIWRIHNLKFLNRRTKQKKMSRTNSNYLSRRMTSTDSSLSITDNFSPDLKSKLNDFIIKRELGCGSFGMVYLVDHKKTGLTHALKLFTPDSFNKKDRLEAYLRFKRGAKIMSTLGHPGVVQVFNFVDEGQDTCYYLMDYCTLGNLQRYLDREKRDKFQPSIHEKVDLILSLCEVVAYAHERHVIHRDIKPSNVLIDWDEDARKSFPKLGDFDLAFQRGNTGLTYGNIGSIFFLPPEIHKHFSQSTSSSLATSLPALQARAETLDIYATTGILYYTLTSCYPPLGRNDEIANEFNRIIKLAEDPQDIAIISALGYIVRIGLSSNVEERPKTIENLKGLVEQAQISPESFRDEYRSMFEKKKRYNVSQKIEGSKFHFLVSDMLTAVTDGINTAFFILENGYVRFMNPAASRLVGVEIDEVLDKPLNLFLKSKEDKNLNIAFIESDEKLDNSYQTFEIIVPKMGTRICDASIKKLEVQDKEHVLLMIEDRTETKNLERKLQQSQKLESIGTLAGGIAHDFNNILMAIVGYTELAIFDLPNVNNIKKNLESVLKASSRASDLIRQLLTFSRQDGLERNPINVGDIIIEVLKMLRATLPTSVEIHQNIQKDAGLILGDPTQIHQIVMNLCTNSYHSLSDQEGVINVMVKSVYIDEKKSERIMQLKPGHYVEIRVTDNGCGMDRVILDRIFEPYFTTKELERGSGLGLAVTHGIVKNHGGAITVESKKGHGSSFHIYFPKIKELKTEEEIEILPRGDEQILLIDDEVAIVELITGMLERLGYKVTGTTNPIQAINDLKGNPNIFDLVITDMTMPKMSGEKLAKEVMKIRPKIPVIMCTGYSEKMNEEKAKSIGIFEFIMKPISVHEIGVAVRKALDKKK